MRGVSAALLLLLMCALLGGCRYSGEVENQAYVLVLGVDRLEDGRLALTARIPKIGSGKGNEAKSDSGDSPFLTFTVAGGSWTQALEELQAATPRSINLSHIEMLIVSAAVASEEGFPALLNHIEETPHLYGTASLVTCEGRAMEFVKAGRTVIGSRMSAEIRAMLSHYASQGYIPSSSLADAYYLMNSFYSDPVSIWGFLEQEEGAPPDGASAATPGILESPMRQRYSGAALFSGGRLVHALSIGDTQLLNLIRGGSSALPLICDGEPHELMPDSPPVRQVLFEDGHARLVVELGLSTLDDVCAQDTDRMEEALRRDVERLIRDCQAIDCEPFGFSEVAVGHFATISDWQDSGWRQLYHSAEVDVRVHIRQR